MALNTEQKGRIVKDFQLAAGDTGSPEVQVALLSARIQDLTEPFNQDYLKRKDTQRYQDLIARLGLRR